MDGLNEAKLIGNVGKEVELKHLDNDKKVAKLVLATNKTYKKQNGEKESRTEWHNIEFWGNTAQFCGDFIKKGMKLYVSGEIRTDKYEKDGQTHYRTKIVGDNIIILSDGGSKNEGANGGQTSASSNNSSQNTSNSNTNQARQQSQQYVNETVNQSQFVGSNDMDDLPF